LEQWRSIGKSGEQSPRPLLRGSGCASTPRKTITRALDIHGLSAYIPSGFVEFEVIPDDGDVTMVTNQNRRSLRWFATLMSLEITTALLVGCAKGKESDSQVDAADTAPPFALGTPKGPIVPKVPFGNQPCLSLSTAEQQAIGMSPEPGKPDRAPAILPADNMCSYDEAQVGFMTDVDYQSNHDTNLSTTRKSPADLPGAFYDKQGGLWFTVKGYDVVVGGSDRFKEKIAHLLVGKL